MTDAKENVWIFTFEYAGVAKIGGLGEVPANQVKHLVKNFDVTVFMPSHGQIERLKEIADWEKFSFNCVGEVFPSLIGINEPEHKCVISFYKFIIDGIRIILLSGGNPFTKKYLDDKSVYNPETFKGKLCFFSLGIRCFINYIIAYEKENLPGIVHLHDYHVVIPFIGIKQELNKNNLDVLSIITIHLLTWPRYPIDFYRGCGIDDSPFSVLFKDGFKNTNLKELFTISKETNGDHGKERIPTVEKIGAIISDLVTTVSHSYLITDIIPNLGNDLIDFKSDFVWDGCDWEYDELNQKVLNTFGVEMRQILRLTLDAPITRSLMKKYLLTYKIGNLSQSPLINSNRVLNTINEISNGNAFVKNGNIRAFIESGPLMLTTGRISPQKGFETIFEAIPKVISVIPNAKFLFLILPTDYSLKEIKIYAEFVKKYPENIRIVFGVASEVFYLAHIAADAYCALSRWEPFGIIALEAMASKLPVIATKVGGLQESIIDLRNYPENGTGMLIEKDNPSQFADALISLFAIAQISEKDSVYETETLQLINKITDEVIKSKALLNAKYYSKIKENCHNRVEYNFRWKIVTKKLIDLYVRLKQTRSVFKTEESP